eukprot:SAG31_NODE_5058_length_2768_cov_1.632072_5_plen_193_part_00
MSVGVGWFRTATAGRTTRTVAPRRARGGGGGCRPPSRASRAGRREGAAAAPNRRNQGHHRSYENPGKMLSQIAVRNNAADARRRWHQPAAVASSRKSAARERAGTCPADAAPDATAGPCHSVAHGLAPSSAAAARGGKRRGRGLASPRGAYTGPRPRWIPVARRSPPSWTCMEHGRPSAADVRRIGWPPDTR